jgi:hypothetical protein
VRHSQRSTNIRVEDIDQPMEVLAGCAKSLVHVPRTGRAIRELDGKFVSISASLPHILSHHVLPYTCHYEVREADQLCPTGEAIESLLQAYGLQYAPEMFVFEKKFMYLRFIGINRELMHRILD